jgi:hypothetical protein
MQNRKAKLILSLGWDKGRGKDIKKGCGRKMWWKYYLLMNETGKMRPVETTSGMGEGR